MICWCHFSVTFFCLSATYRGTSNLLELRVVMKRTSEIISRNNAPRKRNDDNSTIHRQYNLQANSTMKDGIVTIHSPVEIATNRQTYNLSLTTLWLTFKSKCHFRFVDFITFLVMSKSLLKFESRYQKYLLAYLFDIF